MLLAGTADVVPSWENREPFPQLVNQYPCFEQNGLGSRPSGRDGAGL
jgi:hypothetical protein